MLQSFITKTCLYNFDPLKPHFYIVKLGFTGVYIVFLISAYLIEAVLTSTHNVCFEQKYVKYRIFYLIFFLFFDGKIFSIFEYACFRNGYGISEYGMYYLTRLTEPSVKL